MSEVNVLFAQYRGKRLLLDSNLLLLYLVGTLQRTRIATFKRTAQFTESHFDLLVLIMAQFQVIVTTPHILTEVSSLANSLPSFLRSAWALHLQRQTSSYLEVFTDSQSIMLQKSFQLYGLTDAAIQNASAETLVMTEDFRLSGFLHSQGIATLNLTSLAATLQREQSKESE